MWHDSRHLEGFSKIWTGGNLMSTVIDADLGPGHIAQYFVINNEAVCVLTPAALTSGALQDRVRRLLAGQGVDCRACRNCPVGTAR